MTKSIWIILWGKFVCSLRVFHEGVLFDKDFYMRDEVAYTPKDLDVSILASLPASNPISQGGDMDKRGVVLSSGVSVVHIDDDGRPVV